MVKSEVESQVVQGPWLPSLFSFLRLLSCYVFFQTYHLTANLFTTRAEREHRKSVNALRMRMNFR